MADPSGLAQWAVEKLIERFYMELQHIRECDKEWSLFTLLLDSVKERVEEMHTCSMANPDLLRTIKPWLEKVELCLREAEELIGSAPPALCSFMGPCNRLNLRKEILAKRDKLEKLLQDSSLDKLLQIKILGKAMESEKLLLARSTHSYFSRNGSNTDRQNIVAHVTNLQYVGRTQQHIVDMPLQPTETTIGRSVLIEKLESLLLDSRSPKIIGLVGMGGVGKTHLAKTLFNLRSIQSHFEEHLFYITVGNDLGLTHFQGSIYSKISVACKRGESLESFQSRSETEKKEILFNMLKGLKFLLIIDDVWRKDAIECCGLDGTESHWSEPSSKVLITTRDSQMLNQLKAYSVPIEGLDDDESWQLFKHHAFPFRMENEIAEWTKTVAKKILETCCGLPLALKVIGRAMSGKTHPTEWNDALKKLKNHEIISQDHESALLQRLQISYDALQSIEPYVGSIRKCFLYFGAFEDRDIDLRDLMQCWIGEGLLSAEGDPDEQAYIILGVLIGFCLIEKSPDREFNWQHDPEEHFCRIHDILRDLAFYVSRKERPHEDIFEAHKYPTDLTKHIHCVRRISCVSSMPLLPTVKVPNLRVMLLENKDQSVGLCIQTSFFSSFYCLQVLKLRGIDIEHLPESLGELKCLVVIDLSYSRLISVPYALGKLKKLRVLRLPFTRIDSFPTDAMLQLENLQVLDFGIEGHIWDSKQRVLHHNVRGFLELKNLTSLTHLTIGSHKERYLPLNIESMINLKTLHMHCQIDDIEPLKELRQLKVLRLIGSRVTSLPDWICHFTSLEVLELQTCNWRADHLPALDTLLCLRDLRIEGCELTSFPDSISGFQSLERLHLADCKIRYLPESLGCHQAFPFLKHLRLKCNFLQKLPEIEEGGLSKLQSIQLESCKELKKLPSSWGLCGCLPNLLSLEIQDCGIEKLPEVEGPNALSELKRIQIEKCRELKKIPSSWGRHGSLPNLLLLCILGCSIDELPEIGAENALCKLESILIYHSEALKKIPPSWGIRGHLPSLLSLQVVLCGIEELPEVDEGALLKVAHISFQGNTKMKNAPSSWSLPNCLPSLEELRLPDIENFPFSLYPKLKKLYLDNYTECLSTMQGTLTNLCELMVNIQDQNFPSSFWHFHDKLHLSSLKIWGFGIERLQDDWGGNKMMPSNVSLVGFRVKQLPRCFGSTGNVCQTLERLGLYGFHFLEELPDVEEGAFPKLTHLQLQDCFSLRAIPYSYSLLPKLQTFCLDKCGNSKQDIENGISYIKGFKRSAHNRNKIQVKYLRR